MRNSSTIRDKGDRLKELGIPRKNLALMVDPFAQMRTSKVSKILLSNKNKNPNFNDFTLDYPSIGEPDPFYVSDFSVNENNWLGARGSVVGNIDGIDGQDDVLKYWASAEDGYHYAYINILSTFNQYYRISGMVYIPDTNTNIKAVKVASGASAEGNKVITTLGTWVNFDFEINHNLNTSYQLRIYGLLSDLSGSFAGAGVDTDDIFYVKDVRVQRVGLMALYYFDERLNRAKGGGYIGSDWSRGTPNQSSNIVINNSGDSEDVSEFDIQTGVTLTGKYVADFYSKPYSLHCQITGTYRGFYRNFLGFNEGDVFRVRLKYKIISGANIHLELRSWDGTNVGSDNAQDIYLNNDGAWHEVVRFKTIPTGYNGLSIKITTMSTADAEILIDDYEIIKTTDAYHLLPSSGFDYINQMDADDPLFRNGKSARLDGVNDYMISSDSSKISELQAARKNLTVLALITPKDFNDYYGYLSLGGGYSDGFRFLTTPSGTATIQINFGDATPVGVGISGALHSNIQSLIGFTYDGQNIHSFADGELKVTAAETRDINFIGGSLTMGRAQWYWNSAVHMVAIFNRALSDKEMKEVYGKARGYGYYDGSGANAYDGILKNESFIQRIENTDHAYQHLDQSFNYLDSDKLYKVSFRLKVDSGKRAFIRMSSYGGYKDWVYTGDGNWHDYFFYTKGSISDEPIHKIGLYTWDANTVAEWDKVYLSEVLNIKQPSNFVEDFSQGGATYSDELVTNSDTENGEQTVFGTSIYDTRCTHTRTTEVAHSGSYSIKVVSDGTIGNNFYTRFNTPGDALEVGAYYKSVAWVYFPSGQNSAFTEIKLIAKTNGIEYVLASTAQKGQWVKLEGVFKAQIQDVGDFVLAIRGVNTGDGTEYFYWDDISFKKISNGNHGLTQGDLHLNQPALPRAWLFDGVNDKIDFNLGVIDMFNTQWLINFWARATYSQNETIVGSKDGNRFQIRFDNDTRAFQMLLADGTTTAIKSYACEVTDKLHNFTIVNARKDKTFDVYIDNVFVTTFDFTALTQNLPEMMFIGAWSTEYFNNILSDFFMYFFDGQNGRDSVMPNNYYDLYIKPVYEQTKKELKELGLL